MTKKKYERRLTAIAQPQLYQRLCQRVRVESVSGREGLVTIPGTLLKSQATRSGDLKTRVQNFKD